MPSNPKESRLVDSIKKAVAAVNPQAKANVALAFGEIQISLIRGPFPLFADGTDYYGDSHPLFSKTISAGGFKSHPAEYRGRKFSRQLNAYWIAVDKAVAAAFGTVGMPCPANYSIAYYIGGRDLYARTAGIRIAAKYAPDEANAMCTGIHKAIRSRYPGAQVAVEVDGGRGLVKVSLNAAPFPVFANGDGAGESAVFRFGRGRDSNGRRYGQEMIAFWGFVTATIGRFCPGEPMKLYRIGGGRGGYRKTARQRLTARRLHLPK